jgi:hypothetical protein
MCLPDPDLEEDSYDTENCFATGWGKDKFGKLLWIFFMSKLIIKLLPTHIFS